VSGADQPSGVDRGGADLPTVWLAPAELPPAQQRLEHARDPLAGTARRLLAVLREPEQGGGRQEAQTREDQAQVRT
jgi:hypothetical protein